MPCYYVGQTGQSPEERFADHKRGGFTASRCVEKYGVRLLPELYGRLNPMTQLESLERRTRNLAAERTERFDGRAVHPCLRRGPPNDEPTIPTTSGPCRRPRGSVSYQIVRSSRGYFSTTLFRVASFQTLSCSPPTIGW
jgi:hypothetical protein